MAIMRRRLPWLGVILIALVTMVAMTMISPAIASERGDPEICANGIDDDGDGATDEAACRINTTGTPISTTLEITPETWGDNPACSDVGFRFGYKIDQYPDEADYSIDGVNTVTISNVGGATFDWDTGDFGIDAVIVKGGNNSNVYVYDPDEATADTGLGTVESGPDISHIEFCYDYELTAEKTAAAEFTRTYTWTIDKTVDPASHTGWFGDDFTSDYDIVVDQTVVDSDYKVKGEITIDNPTPFEVGFSVADSAGGTAATVDCPSNTLAAGGSVTCTYQAALGAKVDGTNTATITSTHTNVDGTTATANYAFGEPTTVNGYQTINVTDYFDGDLTGEALGSASGDYTFDNDQDFACPTDETLYTDGVYTDSFPNTAKINQTGQSDDANVDITCYMPVVSKDADTEWFEEYTWDITKSADPASHTGFPGDDFVSGYDVFVDQTVSQYGYRAFGNIYVTNPSGEEITVDVSDAVNGTVATVDCGGSEISLAAVPVGEQLTVAAGATGSCSYTVDLTDDTDLTNTATVTFNGYDFDATADVIFGDPTIVGYPTINVTDYFDGDTTGEALGSASGDFTFEYDRNFECPTDEGEYTDGVYTDSIPDYAEIDETFQQDDANVDLTCYLPAEAKVTKTTTEGSENIGQFPFTFELYDPSDNKVETKTLGTGGGTVYFDAEIETEGTWTVKEILPSGWVSTTDLSCTFVVDFPGSADQTYTCTFDNVEKSRVDLVKLTNGLETVTQTWSFALYAGPDGFGTTPLASDSTPPTLLDFGNLDLDPAGTYTLCELEVPAGYSSQWQLDTDGDGVGDTGVTPYNPNAGDDPPEDLGNRCVDIGAGTGIPLVSGETLNFVVDNQMPGGAPRTPGYWKNWNRCTGGNQQVTADANGGWEEGFWLLENVLDPNIGRGIVWDHILSDTFEFPITSCAVAVDILDKRLVGDPSVVGDGKKVASDPLHNLATHLLAAQLNFGAGACTTQEVLDAALDAEELLDKYNFDGSGHDNLNKKSDDADLANSLAGLLDDYNNGEFCGDGDEG